MRGSRRRRRIWCAASTRIVAPQADGASNRPPPPMFAPITLRGLTIPNRVVVSPMCMYSAKDGTVNDWQLVHLGSRAVGGAGLVISEMTDVLPEGRISMHCAGMYAPEHVAAWKRVTDFIHEHSASKVAVQLAHAGRKGSLTRSWEGHKNLGEKANWEILAPSAIPFMEGRQTPRAMNRADMDKVRDAFARAAEMSHEAGFDMIELHFAHGYLISSFISPASNKRTDEYGGSLENRMRFPLEVFRAVRAAWPKDKPISTRISSVDWVEGGTTIEDAIEVARMLHEAGNDILAVSSGGVVSAQPPVDGRNFQATLSDRIRNALHIPTMSVGGIVSHGDINTIVGAGRADMCALGRGYLEDAYFARHAAHRAEFHRAEMAEPVSPRRRSAAAWGVGGGRAHAETCRGGVRPRHLCRASQLRRADADRAVAAAAPRAPAHVKFDSVFWAPEVRGHQRNLMQNVRAQADVVDNHLRRFLIEGLGDAAAYQKTKHRENSMYYAVHASSAACLTGSIRLTAPSSR